MLDAVVHKYSNMYLLKVNNTKARKKCEICSKLTKILESFSVKHLQWSYFLCKATGCGFMSH